MDLKPLTINDCVCVYIHGESEQNVHEISLFQVTNSFITLGSGKGLTPELWAKPLMIYLILLLSAEFSRTLGSSIQVALTLKVGPQYQTPNRTEILIISALETPSARMRR